MGLGNASVSVQSAASPPWPPPHEHGHRVSLTEPANTVPKPQVHSGSPNPEHFNTQRYLQVRFFLLPALAQPWLIPEPFSQAAVPSPALLSQSSSECRGLTAERFLLLLSPHAGHGHATFRSPRCSSSAPAPACSHQPPAAPAGQGSRTQNSTGTSFYRRAKALHPRDVLGFSCSRWNTPSNPGLHTPRQWLSFPNTFCTPKASVQCSTSAKARQKPKKCPQLKPLQWRGGSESSKSLSSVPADGEQHKTPGKTPTPRFTSWDPALNDSSFGALPLLLPHDVQDYSSARQVIQMPGICL